MSNVKIKADICDSDGREIYLGDVIVCDDFDGVDCTARVVGVVCFDGEEIGVKDKDDCFNMLALGCAPRVEVVGSIHDDPELLDKMAGNYLPQGLQS